VEKFIRQLIALLCIAGNAFGQQQRPEIPGVTVDVISTTPLSGVDLSLNEIAAPAQALREEDMRNSGALDLSDFLNRRLTNVHVNEIQGNPFQPDVNYRGYTASPLLGTPQGVLRGHAREILSNRAVTL